MSNIRWESKQTADIYIVYLLDNPRKMLLNIVRLLFPCICIFHIRKFHDPSKVCEYVLHMALYKFHLRPARVFCTIKSKVRYVPIFRYYIPDIHKQCNLEHHMHYYKYIFHNCKFHDLDRCTICHHTDHKKNCHIRKNLLIQSRGEKNEK